jgi:hypothetical protein
MSNTTHVNLQLLTGYALVVKDENAVINRNFFPKLSPSKFNDEWAAMTIKFCPNFKTDAQIRGKTRVDSQHIFA